jgi:hypothetical protein
MERWIAILPRLIITFSNRLTPSVSLTIKQVEVSEGSYFSSSKARRQSDVAPTRLHSLLCNILAYQGEKVKWAMPHQQIDRPRASEYDNGEQPAPFLLL